MKYELITFDLDGTLVDTASEIAEAANRTLETHGLPRRPTAEIELLIGAGTHSLMTRLLERARREQPELAAGLELHDVLESLDRHYADISGTMARPYEGAGAALERLRDAGVRVACVTNKEFRHARKVLEVTGLSSYLELVVGGDSLPEKKPHPSVLQHVASHFGVTLERMAHLGDSSVDVQAAQNAGVAAWAVPYGYNAGKPIEDSRPDRLFERLPDVADYALKD